MEAQNANHDINFGPLNRSHIFIGEIISKHNRLFHKAHEAKISLYEIGFWNNPFKVHCRLAKKNKNLDG
jgi:xanthine dehydrogenase molybdopterin-binding subunit B